VGRKPRPRIQKSASLSMAPGGAEIAELDIARLDNARPSSKGGHRET